MKWLVKLLKLKAVKDIRRIRTKYGPMWKANLDDGYLYEFDTNPWIVKESLREVIHHAKLYTFRTIRN